jgi:myo-inositol-1(or 4)-monophosphatase
VAGELLALAEVAAREAGALLREAFGRAVDGELRTEAKTSPTDFVSEADLAAERCIRERLLAVRPDDGLLGEESDEIAGASGVRWVVDPLDGTTNFLHGYPWYAVSIAALHAGELVAGIVLNVATGETFHATRGGGAWRDGRAIRVSPNTIPERALVGTGFPFKHLANLGAYQRHFAAVTARTAGIRRAGSAALDLCDVACGRFDAFWELTLAPWDVAAGMLIIREAGGRVTDLDGRDAPVAHGPLVAGSAAMHTWLLELLKRA